MLKNPNLQLGMMLCTERISREPSETEFDSHQLMCTESTVRSQQAKPNNLFFQRELGKIVELLEFDLMVKHGLGYTREDVKRFREQQLPNIPSIMAWPLYFCVNSGKRYLVLLRS